METQKEKPETQKNVAKIKVTKNGPYLVSGKIPPLQKQIIIADSEDPPQNGSKAPGIHRKKNTSFAVAVTLRISRSTTAATILKQKLWKRSTICRMRAIEKHGKRYKTGYEPLKS